MDHTWHLRGDPFPHHRVLYFGFCHLLWDDETDSARRSLGFQRIRSDA